MLKKFLLILAMLYAVVAHAAVDVNKASAADLDGVKGIGPAMSKRILDERKKGSFKNWEDFIDRVKGVGEGNAAKFSAEGLTVNGDTFRKSAMTAKDAKKEAKAEAKQEAKEAKAEKKEAKAEAKQEAKEAKAEKKEAQKKAAQDKPATAASAAMPATAASAAKPAASAKK